MLFLLLCIPVRLLLAYIVYKFSNPIVGLLLLLIGCSFIYLYITNSRLNAPEAGGITWWAPLRIVHGLLYLTSSLLVLGKYEYAYVPLLIDAIFGLGAYTVHYYM